MPPALRVLAASATGLVGSDEAPVGGGVAVLEALLAHLAARKGVDVRLFVPGPEDAERRDAAGCLRTSLAVPSLAARPRDAPLAMGALAYARFAREWERAVGARLAAEDPRGAVVLANDVSEGPPFADLAGRGFAVACLWHVVVGDFFARRYLRLPGGPSLPAAAAARAWRAARRLGGRRLAPDALALAFEKEEEAARHAHAVVPSDPLARALERLYPGSGVAGRTTVVPWGVVAPAGGPGPDPARRARRDEVLGRLGLPPERLAVLALSRLSPEKRIDLLLAALRRLERDAPGAADRLSLAVAGAPAYMGGARHARRIARGAARLRRIPVALPGYVAGDAKWDLLAAADLYASTSSYEAYGLGIAQALASGTPVLATPHDGAHAILDSAGGARDAAVLVPADERALARALGALAERDLGPARRAAAAWGREHPFEEAAATLAALLRDLARSAAPSSPQGSG